MRSARTLFIATPCYGGTLTDQYLHSVLELTTLLARRGVGYTVYTLRNESLITRARNTLVAVFLQSGCTDLLFVDADVRFDPESVVRMLESDKPVVGVACPVKQLPLRYAVGFRFEGDPEDKRLIVDDGAVEVEHVGASCLLVRRSVLEQMMAAYPELRYDNGLEFFRFCGPYFYSFFDTLHEQETGRYLSEDYAFCLRWRRIGGRVWLDPAAEVTHVGSFMYAGHFHDLLDWTADGGCRLRSPTLHHSLAAVFPQEPQAPAEGSGPGGQAD